MAYQVILYRPANGLEKMDSKIVEEKPKENWAEALRNFYGAERYEIIEVQGEER